MTVANLSADPSPGWTSMDYMVFWTKPATGVTPPATYTQDYFAAVVSVDSGGTPTYTDGNAAYDDQGDSQYSSVNTVTGTFTPGPRGRSRSTSRSRTWAGVGAPLGTAGAQPTRRTLTGLIVDPAVGNGSWTLGTTSCLG